MKSARSSASAECTPVVLGYTYAALGKYKDAIDAYQLAIDRGDDTPSTQIYLGAAYAHDASSTSRFRIHSFSRHRC